MSSLLSSASLPAAGPSLIRWTDLGQEHTLPWCSAAGYSAPTRAIAADDRLTADSAYRLVCEGTALLWRSDFHNARQLLDAIARRVDVKPRRPRKPAASPAEAFHQYRLTQSQRARTLGALLLPFEDDYRIPLRRAPDVQQACIEAFGPATGPFVASLRELQGVIGAHEWRKKGVEIATLAARIHPYHGVFSPLRGEYLQLIAEAPLPHADLAFDIGTGTGVIAALLAKRGVKRVVATDQDSRALACARDNLGRVGYAEQVEVVAADLFPDGQAPLIVCNPPWIPARPASTLEQAIYDPDSRMLKGFISGLRAHLTPGGEGWLIMSDIAEHLGLRSREQLLEWFAAGGLKVLGKSDIKPHHPRAADAEDLLHEARAAELTSLWRLAAG